MHVRVTVPVRVHVQSLGWTYIEPSTGLRTVFPASIRRAHARRSRTLNPRPETAQPNPTRALAHPKPTILNPQP
jgi:hypothetical protein